MSFVVVIPVEFECSIAFLMAGRHCDEKEAPMVWPRNSNTGHSCTHYNAWWCARNERWRGAERKLADGYPNLDWQKCGGMQ